MGGVHPRALREPFRILVLSELTRLVSKRLAMGIDMDAVVPDIDTISVDCVSTELIVAEAASVELEPIPSPGPAMRTSSGRHCNPAFETVWGTHSSAA